MYNYLIIGNGFTISLNSEFNKIMNIGSYLNYLETKDQISKLYIEKLYLKIIKDKNFFKYIFKEDKFISNYINLKEIKNKQTIEIDKEDRRQQTNAQTDKLYKSLTQIFELNKLWVKKIIETPLNNLTFEQFIDISLLYYKYLKLNNNTFYNGILSSINKLKGYIYKEIKKNILKISNKIRKEDIESKLEKISLMFDINKNEETFNITTNYDQILKEYFFYEIHGNIKNKGSIVFSTLEKYGLETYKYLYEFMEDKIPNKIYFYGINTMSEYPLFWTLLSSYMGIKRKTKFYFYCHNESDVEDLFDTLHCFTQAIQNTYVYYRSKEKNIYCRVDVYYKSFSKEDKHFCFNIFSLKDMVNNKLMYEADYERSKNRFFDKKDLKSVSKNIDV